MNQRPENANPTDTRHQELVNTLATLSREGRRGAPEWLATQQELAKIRVERARTQRNAPTEKTLRSRLIHALSQTPGATPGELAERLGKATSVISRILAELLTQGTVQFTHGTGDRRKRYYSLTAAHGDASEDMSIRQNERQHMALAIGAAVEARRNHHDLEYAADRLERLVRQAEELQAADLVLLARNELITTLRQLTVDTPSMSAAWEEQLGTMLNSVETVPATLAFPLLGCMEYQLGRDSSQPGDQRIRHLTAAERAFQRCERSEQAHQWAPQEGFALLARADLWRRRTEFGKSYKLAEQAAEVFRRVDDTYGQAQAARVIGFCHRLRGDFFDGIRVLEGALHLEGAAVSDRCRADILQQLGDAFRCEGDLSSARDHLEEASDLAERLGRTITLGFALSSLAAVEFAEERLDEAKALSEAAEHKLVGHDMGTAMNDRRLAVILRELASQGDRSQVTVSMETFERSLHRYTDMESPAGAAACLLGMDKLAGGTTPQYKTQVTELVQSSGAITLLTKDPWLPTLMADWANHEDEHAKAIVGIVVGHHPTQRDNPEMAAEPRVLSRIEAA